MIRTCDTTTSLRFSLCLLTIAAASVACSDGPRTAGASKLASVTQPSGDTNVLYWQDKTDMYRGICEIGKPINRTNCVTNMIKLPQADVMKRSMDIGQRGVDSTTTAINAEIKALKANDPTIVSLNQQIAALTQQKTGLETAVAAATTQLQADKTLKAQIDEQLAYDAQQLKAIEKQLLVTPNDQMLLDLQRKLKIEVLDYTAKNDEVSARIPIVQQRLTTQQAILVKVGSDLAAKQSELTKYSDSLEVYSPKLDQLRADKALAQAKFAAVPKVIAAIGTSDIMYRGNIWPKDMQDALTVISSSFGGIFLITPGRYKVESGYPSFCPQKVEITPDTKIYMSFLSPCSANATLGCDGDICRNIGGFTIEFKILDATHYNFKDSNEAVFVLEAPSL